MRAFLNGFPLKNTQFTPRYHVPVHPQQQLSQLYKHAILITDRTVTRRAVIFTVAAESSVRCEGKKREEKIQRKMQSFCFWNFPFCGCGRDEDFWHHQIDKYAKEIACCQKSTNITEYSTGLWGLISKVYEALFWKTAMFLHYLCASTHTEWILLCTQAL